MNGAQVACLRIQVSNYERDSGLKRWWRKRRTRKVLDRDGIVGVYAAGFGAAKFFCRIPALCHRAKHMCGPGVRATKRKVGRWQVQLLLPPNEVSHLSATVPMGYRMADASFSASQIPQESPWSPACRKHTRKGTLEHVPQSWLCH